MNTDASTTSRQGKAPKAPAGSGSLFETDNYNGKSGWVYQTSHRDPETNRRFYVRGFGVSPHLAYSAHKKNHDKRFTANQPESYAKVKKVPTVADYCETWLKNIKPTVGAQTFRKYSKDLENHILPHVGKEKITKLQKQDFHNLFYKKLDKIGTSARFHAYKTFNIVLNAAFNDGVIDRNYLKTIPTPRHTTVVKENDDIWISRRVGIATNMLKWLSNPENPYHDHYVRILFMFLGLRRGEILGMEWSSITGLDRKGNARLRVNRVLNRHEKHTGQSGYYIQPYTKTRNSRRIYLPEAWRKALLAEKQKNRVAKDSQFKDLVFLTPEGGNYSWGKHDRLWREILTAYVNTGKKKYDVLPEEYYFRPHAARHVTASVLFSSGVSIQHAAEILGHDSTRMTEHYTHFMKDQQTASTKALETGYKLA